MADKPFFRAIGYSNCREDPTILQEALQVRSGDVCLSITSGGCNTLDLLRHDPARVLALDFNASQNHLLRFKIAGFKRLEHGELIELMGVRRSTRRRALYGRKKIRRFFDCASLDEQRAFYDREIDAPLWRTIFDLFFSRAVMTRAKDKEHFRLVDFDHFGKIFRARTEHAFTQIPIRGNYFLALILLGHYLDEDALPAYLARENFEKMKARVDRVEIFTGEIERFLVSMPDGTFTKFNVSNLFDWINEPNFVRLHEEIVRTGRDGARMANWNTLLARAIPAQVGAIERFPDRGAELLKRDRAFLYANFEVGIIRK